jgi:hypothetical protein
VLNNANLVLSAVLANPRASWERFKYPVYPKPWHARARRCVGYAGLFLIPTVVFGTEWLVVFALRSFGLVPYQLGGTREIGRLIVAAITIVSVLAGAAAMVRAGEQADHVDIALRKTRGERVRLAIKAKAQATNLMRSNLNASLVSAGVMALLAMFVGVWIQACRSAGWPIGLVLGWVPAAFAGATAFAIVRHLWWLVSLGAALIALW